MLVVVAGCAAHAGLVHCRHYTPDFVAALKDMVVDAAAADAAAAVGGNRGLHSGAVVVGDGNAAAAEPWDHPRHFV